MDTRLDITVLGLFPQLISAYTRESIPARTLSGEAARVEFLNIRDFAHDKRRTCDDEPYGGGAGMVLKPDPIAEALEEANYRSARVVVLTPSGTPFTQRYAAQLAEEKQIILVAGRYEGIDQRVIDLYATDEVSVGDYVLGSGELACLVVIDALLRLLDGAIRPESLRTESYVEHLLEYPHYTRPRVFKSMEVPEVLVSGNHMSIQRWRRAQQIERTRTRRPDLYAKFTGENEKGESV